MTYRSLTAALTKLEHAALRGACPECAGARIEIVPAAAAARSVADLRPAAGPAADQPGEGAGGDRCPRCGRRMVFRLPAPDFARPDGCATEQEG